MSIVRSFLNSPTQNVPKPSYSLGASVVMMWNCASWLPMAILMKLLVCKLMLFISEYVGLFWPSVTSRHLRTQFPGGHLFVAHDMGLLPSVFRLRRLLRLPLHV
jgi:hypothetical protein